MNQEYETIILEDYNYSSIQEKFKTAVNNCISEGWILQGGVSVTTRPDGRVLLAQALTRNKDISVLEEMFTANSYKPEAVLN